MRSCRNAKRDCRFREVCTFSSPASDPSASGVCQCPNSIYGLQADCQTWTWRSGVMFVACVVLIILHAVVVYQSLLCIRRDCQRRRKREHPRRLLTMILYGITVHSIEVVLVLTSILLYLANPTVGTSVWETAMRVVAILQVMAVALTMCLISYRFLHGSLLLQRTSLACFLMVVLSFSVCNVVFSLAAFACIVLDKLSAAIGAAMLSHAATEALLVCTLVKILLDKTLLNRAAPAEEEEAAIEAGKAQPGGASARADEPPFQSDEALASAEETLSLAGQRSTWMVATSSLGMLVSTYLFAFGPISQAWIWYLMIFVCKYTWASAAISMDPHVRDVLLFRQLSGMSVKWSKKPTEKQVTEGGAAGTRRASAPGTAAAKGKAAEGDRPGVAATGSGKLSPRAAPANARDGPSPTMEEGAATGAGQLPPVREAINKKGKFSDPKRWLPNSQVVEKHAKYYVPAGQKASSAFNFYQKHMTDQLSTVEEASMASRSSVADPGPPGRRGPAMERQSSMGNSSIGGRSEAHFSSGGNVITHVDFFRPQKGKVRVVVSPDTEKPAVMGGGVPADVDQRLV